MDSFPCILLLSCRGLNEKGVTEGLGWTGLGVGTLVSVLPSPPVALLNHTNVSTFHLECEELWEFSYGKIMAQLYGQKEVRKGREAPRRFGRGFHPLGSG